MPSNEFRKIEGEDGLAHVVYEGQIPEGQTLVPDLGDYMPDGGLPGDDGPWYEKHWTFNGRVVACPDCWVAGKVSAYGFSEIGMNRFRHNQLTLTCEECDYAAPALAQIRDKKTGEKWRESQWIFPCHPLRHEKLPTLSLVRAPTADQAGDFEDERQHCKWNDWAERQFRSSD